MFLIFFLYLSYMFSLHVVGFKGYLEGMFGDDQILPLQKFKKKR